MGSEDHDRKRMSDIVERLELQAFVADKIQSGMKPLIMDCLEEITNLRIDNAKFYAQAEMNARLLTENASLRAENEYLARRELKLLRDLEKLAFERQTLRKALKPFADAVLKDEYSWKYDINSDDFRVAAAALRESGDE